MATLSEIFGDSASLEKILAGLIGAGTAAAGISQATTPRTTTTTPGTPGAASPLETEALGQGFAGIASQFPSQGLTRTANGLLFNPTADEQQSALGLNRANQSLLSRVGGGPASLQGPYDALLNARATGQPTFDRSRLIASIRTKLSGPFTGQLGQGGVIGGQGGAIGANGGQNGANTTFPSGGGNFSGIPSSFVGIPSSTPGASVRPRATTSASSGGGLGSALGIGTGILGAGAGALQVAKALGLLGGGDGPSTATLLSQARGISQQAAEQIIARLPLNMAIDLGLRLRGTDISQIGQFGKTIFPQTPAQISSEFSSVLNPINNPTVDPFDPFNSLNTGADVANEVSGMLPASQAGEFAGLGPSGVEAGSSALGLGANAAAEAAPDALAGLGADIANSSVGKFLGSGFNTAESLAQSIGLPAGLGIFGSVAGGINGFVHLLMGLFPSNEEAKAQGYSKAVEAQISANPAAWTQKIAKDYGPQFGPFASKMGQFAVEVITGKAQSTPDFRRVLGIPDFVPDMSIEELNLFNSDAMYQFGPLSAAANIEQNTKLPSFLQALPNLTPERPYVDLQNPRQGLTLEEAALSGKYPRLEQTLLDSGRYRRNQDGDLVSNARLSEAGDLYYPLPREQGE